MAVTRYAPTTNTWVRRWFSAQQAQNRGIVRRRLTYVEKFSSLDEVEREVRRRGWHMLIVGDDEPQVVVLCNDGDMQVIC